MSKKGSNNTPKIDPETDRLVRRLLKSFKKCGDEEGYEEFKSILIKHDMLRE